MLCPKCGTENDDENYQCVHCDHVLPHEDAAAPAGAADAAVEARIPHSNTPARIGYYLGVFALIPCLGIPLAVAALALGIMGLQCASTAPEAKGKTRAWAAIGLGAFVLAAHLTVIIVLIALRAPD